MGVCLTTEEKNQKQKHELIENQLKVDKLMEQSEIKMLLLGAGESGKSTILKQMKLLHDNGYTEEERISFKEVVFANVIQCMKVVVDAMTKLNIAYTDSEMERHRESIVRLPYRLEAPLMPKEASVAIIALWADEAVQSCVSRSNEYQLSDSARYFFDAIQRISHPDYIPTDLDVLRIRVKTIGVIETTFQVNNMRYRMFDVGGQRSERKKWIHCFDTVTAVIFLAAISEYDQVLIEDETMNRVREALTLFESICNSPYFVKTSMILFLNKKDLFEKKLATAALSKSFEDYKGANDYESASLFLQEKFMALNSTPSKQIYSHFTCATDVDQIKVVMQAVYDIVVQANLRECGLM